jgi:hypothetical protein
METKPPPWFSRRFIAVASVVLALLGRTPEARAVEAPVLPSLSIRNGDWVAVGGLGVGLLGSTAPGRTFAVVVRGELGLGGVGAGLGLATNMFAGSCLAPGGCSRSDFFGSGVGSLEARVERMYGLTSWRHTTYVGGQLSLSLVIWKPAIGVMFDAHDPRDARLQVATGCGW